MRLNSFLGLLSAILLWSNCQGQQLRSIRLENYTVLKDVFILPDSLSEQISLVYYNDLDRNGEIRQDTEYLKEVHFAIDTYAFHIFSNGSDTMSSPGLSAISFNETNVWYAMYGESKYYGEEKNTSYILTVCPTEQPCFVLDASLKYKEDILKWFSSLCKKWVAVGKGIPF